LLFVEDCEDDVALILLALQNGGFDPTHKTVENAADLKAMLRLERWDAILSDYRMPSFSGTDALRILRATGLDIPFILISGAIGEEAAVDAVKDGAGDYVMKTNLTRLCPALDRQIAHAELRAAHKRTQHDLVASEDRFRRLTALSSDWYWELNENLEFRLSSDGFARKLGAASGACIGKTYWAMPDADADWPAFRAILHRRDSFRDFNVRQLRADGNIAYLSLSGEPLFDPGGRFSGYHGVGTDITARKKDEQLKDEFVATVSHELRTPLTSIVGSLGLLETGACGVVPDPVKKLLDIALGNCKRLVRLVNDILDIEQLETGKFTINLQCLDAKALVAETIAANAAYADEFNVMVRLDGDAAEGRVMADADLLAQLMCNLLSNAVKFSPTGQEVVVSTEVHGDRMRLAVRDRGAGIPSDFKGRIFEKFFQVDANDSRERGGTGLGLSIVKQIATRLAGSVGYEPAPDGGTIFYVDLPRCGQGPILDEAGGMY
jgi:PAS domain S-box-containing protein